MKITKSIVAIGLALATTGMVACDSGNDMRRNPGKMYAPDMVHSRAYDAYTTNPNFSDSMTSRLPVDGTIARGHSLPDHLVEGDSNAYKTFTTNVKFTDAELREGGRLYNIYCGVCHGANLDGNGPLYNGGNGKFAAMPANFNAPDKMHMPVGQMYAAIKFGKNMMGSYASQLDIRQRWQVIAYIKQAQSKLEGGDAFTMGIKSAASDTAKRATTAATDATDKETAAILADKKEGQQ